jgi:hypothetical protein
MRIRLLGPALFITALLSSCGPAPSGGTPTISAVQTHMSKVNARSEDLIYVSGPGETYILSYETGMVVASFKLVTGGGLCSDKHGHVFMMGEDVVYEFAHGGTTPIATLQDTGYRPWGCSVDPRTGDLAVANFTTSGFATSQPGNIVIYRGSKRKSTFYSDPTIEYYLSCGYDDSGNLFLDGSTNSNSFLFAELPRGSGTFTNLTLPGGSPGSVQWDGRYVAVGAHGAKTIYRVAVSGSKARVVSTVQLHGHSKGVQSYLFWLQGNTLLTATGPHLSRVGLWAYPAGGKHASVYSVSLRNGHLGGVTVSTAPSE